MISTLNFKHAFNFRKPVNAKDRLYNDVRKVMIDQKAGFTPMQVNSVGRNILTTLSNTLWYINPHLDKLGTRGIICPEIFSHLQGYHDWKTQKKKEPVISAEVLKFHIDGMTDILMYPWFLSSQMSEFRKACTNLTEALIKYYKFLTDQQQRTSLRHASKEPLRSLSDNWVNRTVEGKASVETGKEYLILEKQLQEMQCYSPLCLMDLEPSERIDRRKWIDNIQLSLSISLYSYQHGNYLGNLNFAWKLPSDDSKRSGMKELQVIEQIKKDIPVFSTRQMKSEFINRYSKTGLKPGVLRDMYRFLSKDQSAPESLEQRQVDQRVFKCLLEADDPDLLYDLRKNNGSPKCKELEPFWQEVDRFLEEQATVHERRQGDHLYMPFAISLSDLRNQIAARLPGDARLPTLSTIRYNFWPPNPSQKSALNYTGRFKVKFAVQQRLLHASHEDKRYAAYQFSLLKEMAVKWRDHSRMICLDDKAIVPVGEPNNPISTGVRPHNRSLALHGASLSALDHDFHVCGIVPSVLFHVKIPPDSRDSFYDGEVHVTLKDKIFQPSSAIRHATESISILRGISSDINLDVPLLFVYTDGGPDHRTTFWSVQLSSILTFIALDLDMLVTARTAPMASYQNPAERCMSLLNLGLQNTSLHRQEMLEDFENKMKRNCSLQMVRKVGEKQPEFKTALLASSGSVISSLKERLGRLKWKEGDVIMHDAAQEPDIEEIQNLVRILDCVEEGISFEKLKTKASVSSFKCLENFMTKHTRQRQYTFQIKKCGNCPYCVFNPIRMSEEDFANLHWLPDPVEVEGTLEEYKSFDQVYGEETDDSSRPSLKTKPQPTEADMRHKGGFVAAKARSFILCKECGKRRVVYGSKNLTMPQTRALERLEEELVYVCGAPLFSDGPLQDVLYVKEALNCSSDMEATYYSDIFGKNHPVCFYCGDTEITQNDIIRDLEKEYGIVRPICKTCFDQGKRPAVRNSQKANLGKRKR